ncbi:predicted protein [Botrytis cinerea T4]|uniref:Uncharacterized protein n=1 Tax=Botryotinia fuckeliana (strain T4) TaxID=999810 RepID=G2YXN8_BOTF4|nr:predicted protein [Botrytis cinerea T4]
MAIHTSVFITSTNVDKVGVLSRIPFRYAGYTSDCRSSPRGKSGSPGISPPESGVIWCDQDLVS